MVAEISLERIVSSLETIHQVEERARILRVYLHMLALQSRTGKVSKTYLVAPVPNTTSRSRGVIRPSFARNFLALSNQRAQGMPDARCTRGLMRNVLVDARMSIQGSGGNPTFPAQWLYGL